MDTIYHILAIPPWLPAHTLNVSMVGQRLFGVSFLFVLKFLGKLVLLFIGSALISKLLRIDKTYDNLHQHTSD